MMPLKGRSVAITGMGIGTPEGFGLKRFREALFQGKSLLSTTHIAPLSLPLVGAWMSPVSVHEEGLKLQRMTDFPLKMLENALSLTARSSQSVQASVLTALEAWQSARLFECPIAPERMGLIISGQNTTTHMQYQRCPHFQTNPDYLSPHYGLSIWDTYQVGVLSQLLNIRGEGCTVGGASASGHLALIQASRWIEWGIVDTCLVVGTMADLSPMELQGLLNMGAIGGHSFLDHPTEASRPFDDRHEGFIYGQLAGAVILESVSSATARNMPTSVLITGASSRLSACSTSEPDLDTEVQVMKDALAHARVQPSDVDYINAHATSTPLGDETEAKAIANVFGEAPHLKINATKSITGHGLWSAGVIETIATVLQIEENRLHPNLNLEQAIQPHLPLVGSVAEPHRIDVALNTGFGFGGINSALVLQKVSSHTKDKV